MSVGEIARCIAKPGWADAIEHAKALRAMGRLSPEDMSKLEKLVAAYDRRG